MNVEKFQLAPDFKICRIIKGGWQLSDGHSTNTSNSPIEDMFAFVNAGLTTFDCADIYTGVEDLIGQFRTEYKKREGKHPDIKVLTKLVPDYDKLSTLKKTDVEKVIDRSLKRLGQERLDMVQYAWWTYDIPGWVETGLWLKEMQEAGKINLISTTNFNTKTTREIIEAGVKIATCQVQYSLLDDRPEKDLIKLCEEHDVQLLCYGTVAGGFLSERWLGMKAPVRPFENRSLTKYKLMVDEFGGWELFQSLLNTLKKIAVKHQVSITNVATRFIIDRKQVAGAIIGARDGSHINDNLRTFSFILDEEDCELIGHVLSQRKSPPEDVFDIERDKEGPHGRIMKYNLNKE